MKNLVSSIVALLGICGIALYIFEKGHSAGYEKGYAEALDDWDCIFDEDYDNCDKIDEMFFDRADEYDADDIT